MEDYEDDLDNFDDFDDFEEEWVQALFLFSFILEINVLFLSIPKKIL